MRIGVLDIGSNTGHLLIVDAFLGGPPVPAHSFKEPLRLAEYLDDAGDVSEEGITRLTKYVDQAMVEADRMGCAKVLAFATSAIREAGNTDTVLDRVVSECGVKIEILPGEDEAKLTFLAVRRWFGWSAGRLGVFDIGGGSLEFATGFDEAPDRAVSLPLGAARLTRDWLDKGRTTEELRSFVRAEIADVAGPFLRGPGFDKAVATSKTFRNLAQLSGAATPGEGLYTVRKFSRKSLAKTSAALENMTLEQVASQPGVSMDRAHQMRAGAIVAEATMDLFGLEHFYVCPWALREGVLIDYLDRM